MSTIQVSTKTTIKIDSPTIDVESLLTLLADEPGDAQVAFTVLEGGDQRDPIPVGLVISVTR
jgi:hypothetical protein